MAVTNLDTIFHRSKERIKTLGEVFTPEKYVELLLDQVEKDQKGIWADEQTSFFEFTAGHGNIVLAILKRRITAFKKKAKRQKIQKTNEYAVSNALNTLWAIDFDSQNVDECRKRVFSFIIEVLVQSSSIESYLKSNIELLAHILCAIKWHCFENEALSALSKTKKEAEIAVQKARASKAWFDKNGHHPMDFETTWVHFYRTCEQENTVPLEFARAVRFLNNLLKGNKSGQEWFCFTKGILEPTSKKKTQRTRVLEDHRNIEVTA